MRRDEGPWCSTVPQDEFQTMFEGFDRLDPLEKCAALVVAWYLKAVNDATLLGLAQTAAEDKAIIGHTKVTMNELVRFLNESTKN
jgi:hypothetical protein